MIHTLPITLSWLILADAAPAGGGNAGGNPGLQSMLPFAPLIILVLLFYMMVLRPARKRARHRDLLGQLKKNDRIITIGGIVGKITNLHEGGHEVTIVTDENSNTKLRILQGAISQVVIDKDHPEEES